MTEVSREQVKDYIKNMSLHGRRDAGEGARERARA